jgi:cytidine deaminase
VKTLSRETYQLLSDSAWSARNNAKLYGPTAVGCAALADDGRVFSGCNIEHRFRSHDIHAEVNAISSLVAAGAERLSTILIAAERDRFTPCGGCLDWIFELGGAECLVINERVPGELRHQYFARELMPLYPY